MPNLNPLPCLSSISRRNLLKLSAAGLAPRVEGAEAPKSNLLYVGTYNQADGPEGSHGNGKGIHLFRMDPATGALSPGEVLTQIPNPSSLALHPDGKHLYSANESANSKEEKGSGSVSAMSVDRATGHLTVLNTVSSRGAGPCHLSVHPSGKFVFVANYHGGTVAVLPVQANGSLGAATDVKEGQGKLGHLPAASAPPGSFAISGHDRTHGHMIQADASGKFIVSTDLGLDRIYVWKFDATAGKLIPAAMPFYQAPSGDGPRHFAWHPKGKWFYSIQEEASTLIAFDYDSATGKLAAKQTISSLPKGFAGTNYTSEVAISADGRFLYAANRLHDSIAVFAISATGTLSFVAEEWTRGDYPRSFTIDPSGRFMYVCNQRADAVTCFKINAQTGVLAFTGQYTPVGTPSIITFL
ncbi:lactonase family protein [uncultured Paludibaculum sp.]|uniref:lactonase family protein n=1 Tax=uncultured Paludibaculum sp. TaxID=1765020 RepID=UPI002AABEF87|nr:lactonase family protein [uncultured Paludibaculum sp.]